MTLYILAAIVICIILGYTTKINIGLFAIAFSYLIGCFGMGMKAHEIVELWPLKIFFVIFAVTLFYNFPLANGGERCRAERPWWCRFLHRFEVEPDAERRIHEHPLPAV